MVLLTGDAVFPGDPLAGQSSSGRGVILLMGWGQTSIFWVQVYPTLVGCGILSIGSSQASIAIYRTSEGLSGSWAIVLERLG